MAELMLAVGLISVVVLAVLGLGISVLRGTRKSIDSTSGQQVAESELQRVIYAAESNTADPLWSANSPTTPYTSYPVVVKSTSYQVAVYAQELVDSSTSLPLGNTTFNQSLKVDVRVNWWDTAGQGSQVGYGNLQASASQVVDGP
jgi:Tfp pilus assembly protein PilV